MVLPAVFLGFSGGEKRSSSVKVVLGRVADGEPGSGANQVSSCFYQVSSCF